MIGRRAWRRAGAGARPHLALALALTILGSMLTGHRTDPDPEPIETASPRPALARTESAPANPDTRPPGKKPGPRSRYRDWIENPAPPPEPEDDDSLLWRTYVEEHFQLSGVLAGVYQYQALRSSTEGSDRGRGAVVFQPELLFAPTETDAFLVKLGIAREDALNEKTPFILSPWVADLQEDVKDINGRGVNTLITALYRKTLFLDDDQELTLTGGIIDATEYLDQSEYAWDEYTQFMNAAFVNVVTGNLPSYDYGGVVEWTRGPWCLTGLGMAVGENEDGNSYGFFGGQVSRQVSTPVGTGNYRLTVTGTNRQFLDAEEEDREALLGASVSADQEIGPYLGLWTRVGVSDRQAAVTHDALFSGGVDLSGALWGREDDNVGVGYAELSGGNLDVDRTAVLEAYVRFGLTEHLAATFDAQYQYDDYPDGETSEGWTFGVRLAFEFGNRGQTFLEE